ncbi:hydroxyisourate hydrolase [Gordonia sp. CPCC 206044]|uniref:hydroxyisourate hydrolase n=1 Tax=Gordonia sp. CPCC 206044 TaxID=3140793 RepID=UPI003AF390BF
MTGLSTHVLDAASGSPASGMSVSLQDAAGAELANETTDADGRITQIAPDDLVPGIYHLVFDTGNWFAANAIDGFYPEIDICFEIADTSRHHHVPVLLSPYSYTTYRGS